MKCKFLIEKDSGEKEMAMQVDEVTKGLKITSLSAKKSGIKTNSVHQTRWVMRTLLIQNQEHDIPDLVTQPLFLIGST